MRVKLIAIALLVGLLSPMANAQNPALAFDDFDSYVTGINVWELSASDDLTQATGWLFYMDYAPEDIVVETVLETTNHHIVNMYPNTHAYTNDPGQFASGGDGANKFEQLLIYQHEVQLTDDRMFLDVDVNFNGLDTDRYTVYASFRMINTNIQPPPLVDGYIGKTIALPTNGTYNLDSSSLGGFQGMTSQAAFALYGQNANPADTNDYGSGYVTLNITNLNVQFTLDNVAPVPDPPEWDASTAAISDRAVQCVAATSTDDKFPVQYNFENRTQGYASGWQLSTNWLDQGAASDATGTLSVVNADFETGSTGYQYSTNTSGSASAVSVVDDSGNGVAYTYVNGSDGGEGGFALVTQTVDLTDEPLGAGDTVTLSGDIKAVTTNQNFGGSILKLEAYDVLGNMLGSKEVTFTNVTDSWDTYSMDYKLPANTEEVLLAAGVTTGWAVTNDADSHYYFDNLEISGVYTEYAGLTAGQRQNYYLWTRDSSASTNLTIGSRYKRVTMPAADTVAPTPATMSFTDSDASATIVKLQASEASDASAVEYYFECTSGPGNNSGWQDSPVYYDRGLTPGTNYSYTVIARDTSHAQNSNTVSAATNITTIAAHTTVGFTNDLKGYTGDTSTLDGDIMVEKDGLETASSGSSAIIEFDGSGATFGAGLDGTGRDLLKTTATGYGDWNVTAYATFAMPATEDESAYIGIGTGLQTGEAPNWGIPELAMDGGYGVVAELKDLSAGDSDNTNCTVRAIFNGVVNEYTNTLAVTSNEIVRAQLVYSAEDKTVSVYLDKNYTGGAFETNQVLGTVSTEDGFGANVLAGGVVSVYVGGGEGTLVSDFEVSIEVPELKKDQPPYDIENPTMGPSGMVFEWTGVSTRTYDVLYKTNLLTGAWQTNTTIVGVDGAMSATGTVDEASVFYKLLSR